MVMPDELTHLAENGVNRFKGCCPIDFRFEPPPEAFHRLILWGIRRQVFQGDPVVLREKSFDRTTLVHCGLIQDQDQQGLRQPLRELMQTLQKARGCAACGPLPINALGAQLQRPKQGGTLTLRWRRDFDLLALATPATLDVRFMRKMGGIDTEDFSRLLRLVAPDGGNHCCHSGAFFLRSGSMLGDRCGEAFGDPISGLQLAADRGITGGLLVLGKIITDESHGPALCNRAEVGGTVGSELLKLCRDALPKSGRSPRLWGVVPAGEARRAIRLEPGAHGMLMAVEAPGNLWNAPALGIE
jgi:hypothetical protein